MKQKYPNAASLFCRIAALFLCWGMIVLPAHAQGLNVQTHTQDEIRSFIKNSGASISDTPVYSKTPVTTAPYDAGELSSATQQSALKILNWMRYIAGIDANVVLDSTYCQKAQAGMLLNQVNNTLTHTPAQPSDMDAELYELGYSGTSSSNIGWGYRTLGKAIVNGWMEDGDASNISRVGHRRWILNPSMAKTGFGMVGSYSAVYAFDRSRTSSYTNVAWPAQNMPIEYFSTIYPWSLSTGQTESISAIHVKLVRTGDNKVWNFSSASSDGEFYVNNDGYGQKGCIIFRPDDITAYNEGDIFDVTITGTASGTINYTVQFFSLTPVTSIQTGSQTLTMTENSSQYLNVNILPSEASIPDITWTTSNSSIVTVVGSTGSPNAKLYAARAGTAVVTASCSSGGKTFTAKCQVTVNHVPGASATCTSAQYCTKCQTLLAPALGHKWDSGTITVKATSTSEGIKTYTCTTCGIKKQESIPKLETTEPADETDTPKAAAIGTKLTVSSTGTYKVTKSGSSPTVSFTKPGAKKKTVTIPATIKKNGITYKVTSIAANAFKGNTTVTTVKIGKNVTSVGSKAFYGCKKLKTVTMGTNVKTIGSQAFYKCTALKTITIPSKVSTIGKQAFYGCKNLKTITVKSTKLTSKKVGASAFKGTYSKATVKVPKGKTKTYKKILQAKGLSKKAKIK